MRRIAVGGMAEVYLARYADGPEDAHVVIKQILPQLAEEPDLLQLFIDEARIASRVVHPGIVRVLDVGVEAGVHFLAMEYVDGLDLSQLMRVARDTRGAFPVPVALRIAIDLCGALHHAHEATEPDGTPLEIVHRDVSPQNVLISRTGHVKLTDFGIARARIRARRTATGVLRGKIAYVSPEQYSGERGDRRVDVYAVGVVLYEMLAGRRPFMGDEAMLIRDVMTKESPPLTAYAPWIDPRLAEVIARALMRFPVARVPSAAALAQALDELGLAGGSDQLSALACEAIEVRDRSKSNPERSAPSKVKPTMTLAQPAGEKVKRTETLPVQVPEADARDTEIQAAAREEPEPDEDSTLHADLEGDTVYASPPSWQSPPPTNKRWPVRAMLSIGVVLAFVGGWIFATLDSSQGEEIEPITLIAPVKVDEVIEEEEEGEEVEPDPEAEPEPDPEVEPDPQVEPDPEGEAGHKAVVVKKRPVKKKRRERPRPPIEAIAPPVLEGFGELSLDTQPWSHVRLGKRELGPTPLARVRLAAGRHRLVLENPEQGLTRTIILVVKPDEHVTMRVRLSDGQVMKR